MNHPVIKQICLPLSTLLVRSQLKGSQRLIPWPAGCGNPHAGCQVPGFWSCVRGVTVMVVSVRTRSKSFLFPVSLKLQWVAERMIVSWGFLVDQHLSLFHQGWDRWSLWPSQFNCLGSKSRLECQPCLCCTKYGQVAFSQALSWPICQPPENNCGWCICCVVIILA